MPPSWDALHCMMARPWPGVGSSMGDTMATDVRAATLQSASSAITEIYFQFLYNVINSKKTQILKYSNVTMSGQGQKMVHIRIPTSFLKI